MKKIYIILLEPSETPVSLREKIQNMGNCYKLYDSYLICSEVQSTEELYYKIIGQEYKSDEIVILELPLEKTGYFGYADRSLWAWITENIANANVDISQRDDVKNEDSSADGEYFTTQSAE